MDVQLHGITNLPASWTNESGTAPMFSDHVFRYEVDVSVGNVACTFKNGRLLQSVPVYTDFIASAKLPPFPTATAGDLDEGVPTIPQADGVPCGADNLNIFPGAVASDAASESNAAAPPAILWVLGPETDSQEAKEDPKAAKAQKKPPANQVAAEVPKAIPPNASVPPLCVQRLALELPSLEHLCLWFAGRLKADWPGLSRITVSRPTIHERCVLTL